MTYEELVAQARETYGKMDAGNVKEHVAIQFNITGEALLLKELTKAKKKATRKKAAK